MTAVPFEVEDDVHQVLQHARPGNGALFSDMPDDEDGDFHFVGRKKDIIRRGGENISASSVEHVLLTHSKISEAAAIAVPDKVRGEEVKVYIVLKEGQKMTYEEVIMFCGENMAAFKVPRYIEFRDSLPKTPTDRIQKRKLFEETADLTVG